MFFSLVFSNNYGFSILQEISKFSQNVIICGCLLLQIFLWQKYPIAVYIIKNYIHIFTAFNILILLSGFLFEFSFTDTNFCLSSILKILPVMGFGFNLLVITMALYNSYEEQNEVGKNGGLLHENDNLGAIIDKYTSSLQKMRKYYLIFIISFTLSYFVDIYFKFSNVSNDNLYKFQNTTNIVRNIPNKIYISFNTSYDNLNANVGNSYIYYNNTLNQDNKTFDNFKRDATNPFNFAKFNSIEDKEPNDILKKDEDYYPLRKLIESNLEKNVTLENLNKNEINVNKLISACDYYKDLGEKYSIKELIVCLISFAFRDIGPHIYIFISLFIYKPETLSRSSSFIEI
jgi:hypothetical protein